ETLAGHPGSPTGGNECDGGSRASPVRGRGTGGGGRGPTGAAAPDRVEVPPFSPGVAAGVVHSRLVGGVAPGRVARPVPGVGPRPARRGGRRGPGGGLVPGAVPLGRPGGRLCRGPGLPPVRRPRPLALAVRRPGHRVPAPAGQGDRCPHVGPRGG